MPNEAYYDEVKALYDRVEASIQNAKISEATRYNWMRRITAEKNDSLNTLLGVDSDKLGQYRTDLNQKMSNFINDFAENNKQHSGLRKRIFKRKEVDEAKMTNKEIDDAVKSMKTSLNGFKQIDPVMLEYQADLKAEQSSNHEVEDVKTSSVERTFEPQILSSSSVASEAEEGKTFDDSSEPVALIYDEEELAAMKDEEKTSHFDFGDDFLAALDNPEETKVEIVESSPEETATPNVYEIENQVSHFVWDQFNHIEEKLNNVDLSHIEPENLRSEEEVKEAIVSALATELINSNPSEFKDAGNQTEKELAKAIQADPILNKEINDKVENFIYEHASDMKMDF